MHACMYVCMYVRFEFMGLWGCMYWRRFLSRVKARGISACKRRGYVVTHVCMEVYIGHLRYSLSLSRKKLDKSKVPPLAFLAVPCG